jgi:hypothetical protein
MRSSKPKQACCVLFFSYSLVSSVSFPLASPISLSCPQLNHHRRIQSYVISIYFCMPWSLDNTAYSIHRVQHAPKCVSHLFILMIKKWLINVALESGMPLYRLTFSTQPSKKNQPGQSSYSHGDKLTSKWIESQQLVCLPIDSLQVHPSISLTCDLKLYLHSHSITASNITSVWPPSSSLSLLDLSLKVYLQTHSNTASQCISKLAWSQLQTLHDYGLQVPFETSSILTFQFIQLGRPSASLILLNYGVHMCSLEFNLISMCRHTSNVSPAQLAVSSNTYHV